MKAKRTIALILGLFTILFLLTACDGYNSRMRKHLSDKNNYHSYTGTIRDIYYFDADNQRVSLMSIDKIPQCDIVIELTFDDYDTVKKFLGGDPNPEWSLDKFVFSFDITTENSQRLAEHGFYDAVTVNTLIEVIASSYIYMDSDFFFVAGVNYNETEYLCFEDGIESIREYLNEHKSLL